VHFVIAISESGEDLLYPHITELILGAIAFFILFAFMYKWVIPRANAMLEERRKRIQGDLEKAEQSKNEAEQLLGDYREQLAGAREDANRIIEEARRTAEAMRRDMVSKAEQEYQAIVGRAQEEIRAERDRVFQELKTQVGELTLTLAGRVVGEKLDKTSHLRLVDDYIKELDGLATGNGRHSRRSSET
jgi:F-type H+-transporting ATPase subunit b